MKNRNESKSKQKEQKANKGETTLKQQDESNWSGEVRWHTSALGNRFFQKCSEQSDDLGFCSDTDKSTDEQSSREQFVDDKAG